MEKKAALYEVVPEFLYKSVLYYAVFHAQVNLESCSKERRDGRSLRTFRQKWCYLEHREA
jgi:hypothetical protein